MIRRFLIGHISETSIRFKETEKTLKTKPGGATLRGAVLAQQPPSQPTLLTSLKGPQRVPFLYRSAAPRSVAPPKGQTRLPLVIKVLPVPFVASKSGTLMEFKRLRVHKIARDEFHLPHFVLFAPFRYIHNVQIAPIHLVNRFFQLTLQSRLTGFGMGRLNQVVDEAKEISTVAGPHQLLSRLGFGFPVVILHTTVRVTESALARTEGLLSFTGDFFSVLRHPGILALNALR